MKIWLLVHGESMMKLIEWMIEWRLLCQAVTPLKKSEIEMYGDTSLTTMTGNYELNDFFGWYNPNIF